MQTYAVRLRRVDDAHVTATVREYTLVLGAKRADAAAGFNPVETLLAAMGDCLLTALHYVSGLSRVPMSDVWLEAEADRQDRPPVVTAIRYVLHVATSVSDERVQRLIALAEANSTVFQTLGRSIPIEGRWERSGETSAPSDLPLPSPSPSAPVPQAP